MTLRRNNIKLAQSAVYKLSNAFYGRNDPFYQLIEFHILAQIFTIQDEVQPLYENNFSVSLSGDGSKGEDWDFVLENIKNLHKGRYQREGVKKSIDDVFQRPGVTSLENRLL